MFQQYVEFPEISDNSYCSILLFFLGIANDGEAHSEE
jgi:hypothetical protein